MNKRTDSSRRRSPRCSVMLSAEIKRGQDHVRSQTRYRRISKTAARSMDYRSAIYGTLTAILLSSSVLQKADCQATEDPTLAQFQLSPNRMAHRVPSTFLGFTLDWNNGTLDPSWSGASLIEIDLQNARLRQLASALAPAVLRVGGFLADVAMYDVGHPPPEHCPRETCLTMERWNELVGFAQDTGAHLLFDVRSFILCRICPTLCTAIW
jgi:hypothetical protein